MKRLSWMVWGVLILLGPVSGCAAAQTDWRMQPSPIETRWAKDVSPTHVWPEYPRPQMAREEWRNLNGLWDYAITPKDSAKPARFQGRILVPYPIESALSGVKETLMPDQLLWYRRTIARPSMKSGERTLLNFGAVDWQATVYVNGAEVGGHTGGYQSFSIDITDALKAGENELLVKVYDPTDQGPNPHGKQVLNPGGIMYTPTSGIWQTVWLETVPRTYIERLVMTPDVDRSQLTLTVDLKGGTEGHTVQATAKTGSQSVATETFSDQTALKIANPRLWSPDDPFLYDLEVHLLKDGKVIDTVKSYFGLRKIEVKTDATGVERIFLNDQYTYNLGVLDQGFWPDGLYTAPTDEALKFDIQAIKAMGFNTIRKHIKIEPARWYYHCDRLGMMVWQDMVNPGNDSAEARAAFEKENKENLAQLHNHPSITTWVLFNEGWGTYDQARLTQWVKTADPSRLVNGHSGENYYRDSPTEASEKWANSDMADIHVYPQPAIPAIPGLQEARERGPYLPSEMPSTLPGKARVLGEFGGLGVFIENHIWNDLGASWGYVTVRPENFAGVYAEIIETLKVLEAKGLSGSIYTQPFDVEDEQNGLMTYDREVIKIPAPEFRRLNAQLVATPRNYVAATKGFSIKDADIRPEEQRYAQYLAEFERGKRDLAFLRRLTLMALRQDDAATATRLGNEYIDRVKPLYTKEALTFINHITQSSRDKGFELFRTEPEKVNAVLGAHVAERKIREIIGREEIAPHVTEDDGSTDWIGIERRVVEKYGDLGAEKFYGARMGYAWERQDWPTFAKYYVLYFERALGRSEYHVNNMSWSVFEHVADPKVLEAAIRAMKYDLQTYYDNSDPGVIDTYANLLYKAGRVQEAIEWQEKAIKLAPNLQVLADNLNKMRAGQPTWPIGEASQATESPSQGL